MSDPVVQHALRELTILTECTCSGLPHQPDCPSYWREDVDTLRAAVAQLTAVADAARGVHAQTGSYSENGVRLGAALKALDGGTDV